MLFLRSARSGDNPPDSNGRNDPARPASCACPQCAAQSTTDNQPVTLHSPCAVLPGNTPMGGPQHFNTGGKKEAPARGPLTDVTAHFTACTKGSICIGALGGSFGLVDAPSMPSTALTASSCHQQAALEAHSSAAQARAAAAKRQALRTMR